MTSMFNTSDFIYIHTYVWLSGWTHRAGISDSISVPAPCSLLSLVTVPGKLGLVERGNTLQSAGGGGLCFQPHGFASLGRQAEQPRDIKEVQRKQSFPEGATMPQMEQQQRTSRRSEPCTPCQGSHPCLQPGLCSLQMEGAARSPPGTPARLCPHPRTARRLRSPSPAPTGPSWNKLLPNAWLGGTGKEGSPGLYLALLTTQRRQQLHLKTQLPANYQINPRISTAFLHYFLSQPNHKFT